jgi:Peptidase family M28
LFSYYKSSKINKILGILINFDGYHTENISTMQSFLKNISLSLLILSSFFATAQSFKKLPESKISRAEVENHIRFLASDEMKGRRTGEQGNQIAARYLAEQFRMLGLKPANGDSYLQPVPLVKLKAAAYGSIIANGDTLKVGKEFVIVNGGAIKLTADVVFVGYGLADDYKNIDVKNKIVVAQSGSPDALKLADVTSMSSTKRKLAAEKGAATLIELFNAQVPWNMVTRFTGGEALSIDADASPSTLPHIWANGQQKKIADMLKTEAKTMTIDLSGRERVSVATANVAGIIEGTDPTLKNEYVIVSAHFDHIGISKMPVNGDSISNGARDNAFGTTALLAAAKALAQKPGKRSVLILAVTGEEVGLLGSRFYAQSPLVPLKQCVFDLNSDGAGYEDVSIVSVIGLDRTNCKTEIETACKAFGLNVFADPAPEQGLFDRSDNVSFAAKGIPAPTFSAGFKTFGPDISKYYHQVADGPESIDFDYLLKFSQAFAHTTRLIANKPIRPQWTAGDKYEPAAKTLYGQ